MDKKPITFLDCVLMDLKNVLLLIETGRTQRGVDNLKQLIKELEHEVQQTK